MKEKLLLFWSNKDNRVGVGVIILFVFSAVFFVYALGFVKFPTFEGNTDSATTATSLPMVTSAFEMPTPPQSSADTLNNALNPQGPTKVPTPTTKKTPTPTPTVTTAPSPTITPAVAATTAPTVTSGATPTNAQPSATPIMTPTEIPSPTPADP